MLLTVVGASIVSLITGYSIPVYGANYVNFAMFMAFALLYPDAQVLLFFVFPIRMSGSRILTYSTSSSTLCATLPPADGTIPSCPLWRF